MILRAFAFLAALIPNSVFAENCFGARDIAGLLLENFGEKLSYTYQLPNKNILEVFSNAETDSWTVTVFVLQADLICVLASGRGNLALHALIERIEFL